MYAIWGLYTEYQNLSTFTILQVSSSSITYCNQWYCCLCFWILLWQNPFDQIISKEDMGRFHWSISYNNNFCICGELVNYIFYHLFSKQAVVLINFLYILTTDLIWVWKKLSVYARYWLWLCIPFVQFFLSHCQNPPF